MTAPIACILQAVETKVEFLNASNGIGDVTETKTSSNHHELWNGHNLAKKPNRQDVQNKIMTMFGSEI